MDIPFDAMWSSAVSELQGLDPQKLRKDFQSRLPLIHNPGVSGGGIELADLAPEKVSMATAHLTSPESLDFSI